MNRVQMIIALVAIGAIGILVGPPLAGTAQSDPSKASQHPLVGAWIVDPETSDPANPPSFDIFMADGTLVNVGSDGTSIGVWEATGPTTAIFTFNGLLGEQGAEGMFVIRANIEVADDGQSFAATHAFSILTPDGTVVDSFQGGGSLGTRMSAEGTDMGDQPLPGFQSWMPATAEATPEA